MHQRHRTAAYIFIVVLGLSLIPPTHAVSLSAEPINIDLAQGYILIEIAWITDGRDTAVALIASEEENAVRAAVITQMSDGQYGIAAQSDAFITYAIYSADDAQLLKQMQGGGQHCYWNATKGRYDIVIAAQQDTDGVWTVRYGYTHRFHDALPIALPQGYAMVQGAWIAGGEENVLALIGNEEDNVMKVAVAEQTDDGEYQIVAQSQAVLSYDEYNAGGVQLLDHMREGRPYFWYETKTKDIYFSVAQDAQGVWNVTYGYAQYYGDDELHYVFCASENPNEIIVYEIYFPQIYWPVQATLMLDRFDFYAIEDACTEALRYLHEFQSTHEYGDEDDTYKVLWTNEAFFSQTDSE